MTELDAVSITAQEVEVGEAGGGVAVGLGVAVGVLVAAGVGVTIWVGLTNLFEEIVKVSITSPWLQLISLVPPPGGPQRKYPWIPVWLNKSLVTPWRIYLWADQAG